MKAMSRPPLEELIPSSLDLPEQWLAIRSGNIAAVQETLGLSNPQRCTWKDGFAISGVERLFISPPVNGWILVVGPALPRRKRMWIFVSISSATSANALGTCSFLA